MEEAREVDPTMDLPLQTPMLLRWKEGRRMQNRSMDGGMALERRRSPSPLKASQVLSLGSMSTQTNQVSSDP
jgi:hypothetical protein